MKKRQFVLITLFVTWFVSYMDRLVMSVAIPYIAKDFNLTPVAMGTIMSAFFAGYALMQIPGGMLADKFGARRLMSWALAWWSAFTALTAVAGSFVSMIFVRVLFGVGEGVFPGGYFKSVAIWFPTRERTTANAFMMAGTILGPALAPLFVVAVMSYFGWRTVFSLLLIPGLILAFLIWQWVPDKPSERKGISPEELNDLEGEPVVAVAGAKKIGIGALLKMPIIWKLFLAWFCLGTCMWGFMSWLPTYLVKERGFAMVKMGLATSVPFFAGFFGSIVGGWISDKFFVKLSLRRIPFCASVLLGSFFLYMAYAVTSPDMAIVYLGCVGFFMYSGLGSFWAIPLLYLPKEVMGSSGGMINFGSQIGGFFAPMIMGWLLQSTGKFESAFTFMVAAGIISALLVATISKHENPTTS